MARCNNQFSLGLSVSVPSAAYSSSPSSLYRYYFLILVSNVSSLSPGKTKRQGC